MALEEEKGLDLWNPNEQEEDGFDLDAFSEEQILEQLMFQEQQRIQNEYSVLRDCCSPTLLQGLESVWLLLVLCLLLRCISLAKVSPKVIHFLSALSGIGGLWHFYGNASGYVVLLCVIGYLCFSHSITGSGAFLSFVCVGILLGCEKFIVEELEWNKIRGSVMIVSMKLIYLGFEKNCKDLENLSSFGYFGYLLNPASIIFGPFITYKDYLQLFSPNQLTFSWIGNVFKTIMLSTVCLLWSTCGNSFLLPQLGSSKWLDAYKDANGFRFSTYFVSYISESTCLVMGVATIHHVSEKSTDTEVQEVSSQNGTKEKNSDLKTTEEITWSRPVSNPMEVEIPRSLVEVVTNWNLPMHYWLKNYVFKSYYKSIGIFPAILLTYFASAMLHGLNFQLSIILLSIGIFAYIENDIRKTLATTFDSCIEARRCKSDCNHSYKQTNFWVVCTNLAFGFVALWNLAYLGCLFDNNPEIQDTGYSMYHALRKWANLGYVCHYVMFGVFVVNKMIRDGVLFESPHWLKKLGKWKTS
eukprot:gene7254-8062_t